MEQRSRLRELFNSTIVGEGSRGRLQHHFTLGPADCPISVSRKAWASAHNVSVMLETLSREKKSGCAYAGRSLRHTSHHCADLSEAMRALANNNLEPTRERLKLLLLTNTNEAFECYDWMKSYFDIAGDHMPNSNEIHLENTRLMRLYKVYQSEVQSSFGYNSWITMWIPYSLT